MATRPIGAVIKERRQQLGIRTQAALAARIHQQTGLAVSRTTVANWETGKHYPGRYIGALEAVLGDLTTGEETEVYTDPTEAAVWADTRLPAAARREAITQIRRARHEEERRRRPA